MELAKKNGIMQLLLIKPARLKAALLTIIKKEIAAFQTLKNARLQMVKELNLGMLHLRIGMIV